MSDIVEGGEAATQTGLRRAAELSWQILRATLAMIGRAVVRVLSAVIGAPRQYARAVERDRNAQKGEGVVTLKHFAQLSKGPREIIRVATPELSKQTARELRKHGLLYAAENLPDGTVAFHVRKRDSDTARHALQTAGDVLRQRAERTDERALAKSAKNTKGAPETAEELAAATPKLPKFTAKEVAGIRAVLDEFAATLDAAGAERVRGFAASIPQNGKTQTAADAQAVEGTKATVREGKEVATPAPKEVSFSKLVAHGAAPYMNDPKNTMNYFVTTEDAAGKQHTQWGVDLERAVTKSDAQVGDQVRLEKTGTTHVTLPNGQEHERGSWQVSKQTPANTDQATAKEQTVTADAPVQAQPTATPEMTPQQAQAAPAQTSTPQTQQNSQAQGTVPTVSDGPVSLTAAESAGVRAELEDYAAMQSPEAAGRLERLAATIQETGAIPNERAALADVRNARGYAENTGTATANTTDAHKRVAGSLGARTTHDAAKAADTKSEPPAKDPPRRAQAAQVAMPVPSGMDGAMSMGGGM